jgi:hypothetical protein
MATRKPLVIVAGQVEQLQSGDSLDVHDTTMQLLNDEATPVVIGAPVYSDAAGGFKKARSNAVATSKVVGLVADSPSITNGASGSVATADVLTATTAEWDAVTGGSGGLTFNTIYYLDPTTAGKMTSTAPTTVGQLVVQLGVALSTIDFKINIQQSILL